MASTYLTITPSCASNRQTLTCSGWVKRSSLGARQGLFSVDTGAAESTLGFLANDTLRFYQIGQINGLVTNQVFRDVGAWYHIVLTSDTTQSTASSRTKLYINGEQVTSFSSAEYLNQNADTEFNTTNPHEIGFYSNQTGGAGYFDGYMAHVHFTDGTAYAASTFGSTATNGQWVPNQTPSVTYGTNGFFLNFKNASDLGEDFSGNNNDYTKSGSGDKVLDNPQNVFATFNALFKRTSVNPTFSQGNCKVVQTASNGIAYSTIGVSSGKWYVEIKVDNVGTATSCGILEPSAYDNGNPDTQAIYYQSNGNKNNKGSASSYGASYTTGDIIGIAFDADNGTLAFYKNGVSQGTAFTGLDTNTTWLIGCHGYGVSGSQSGNYGNPPFTISSGNSDDNGYGNFEYAPPSTYLALCTNNLSSELTLPIGKGSSYFNPVLYTGNGTSQTITGVGYQPDFVWIKNRQQADWHNLVNIVSGATRRLSSNNTSAENDNAQNVSAFTSDGFSVGNDHNTNANGENYVSWNWLASNSTASNTDGSVTTTVSANTTAGFSVVNVPTTGSVLTAGHGLSKAPSMIIFKSRDKIDYWPVYHASIAATKFLILNSTGAAITASTLFNNTEPTSTVFTMGTENAFNNASQNTIAYCFAEIEGYSKFGSYTGNGSTDGAFVYTGFRPAFIITKKIDGASNWGMLDATRSSFNVADDWLGANLSNAESVESTRSADLLSNGFKARGTNADINDNSPYIYMAFAENPFVDSSGIPVTAR